jgi:hypothetical protein
VTRPFPAIGARVRMVFPGENPNTWPEAGTVLGIFDDEVMVVRRRVPDVDDNGCVRRYAIDYELISKTTWSVFDPTLDDANGGGGIYVLSLGDDS